MARQELASHLQQRVKVVTVVGGQHPKRQTLEFLPYTDPSLCKMTAPGANGDVGRPSEPWLWDSLSERGYYEMNGGGSEVDLELEGDHITIL